MIPNVLTVTGGQHFTATAQDSLQLSRNRRNRARGGRTNLHRTGQDASKWERFPQYLRHLLQDSGKITHNPSRPLIENLEDLPFPGYHLVKDNMPKYHFSVMAGKRTPYALIEGARGCNHQCTFCTQWRHWQACWRVKSAKRIADEMAFCNREFGSKFIWLTDDNFGAGQRPAEIAEEIIAQQLPGCVVVCSSSMRRHHPQQRRSAEFG